MEFLSVIPIIREPYIPVYVQKKIRNLIDSGNYETSLVEKVETKESGYVYFVCLKKEKTSDCDEIIILKEDLSIERDINVYDSIILENKFRTASRLHEIETDPMSANIFLIIFITVIVVLPLFIFRERRPKK